MCKPLDSGKNSNNEAQKFLLLNSLTSAVMYLFYFRLSLIALHKYASCHHVLQKHNIRCFCKTWLQLVFLRSAIQERWSWDKVLTAKMSLSLAKLVY